MIKRIILAVAMVAMLSASSTAMAGHPFRGAYRSFYAPVPVVRHYGYYPPTAFYSYRPAVRAYYPGYRTYRPYVAPAPVYAPAPVFSPAPVYGGVSVAAPGVSLRIGF